MLFRSAILYKVMKNAGKPYRRGGKHHHTRYFCCADCRLAMELTITKGRGYISADKGKSDDMPIGVLAVDAIYTPVDRVNMTVENTRVGQCASGAHSYKKMVN